MCPPHVPTPRDRSEQLHWICRLALFGVVGGMLMLIGGSCVILVWAFQPDVSARHPIGLRIGAVVCSLGVLFVLLGVVGVYRWQRRFAARLNDWHSDATELGAASSDENKGNVSYNKVGAFFLSIYFSNH